MDLLTALQTRRSIRRYADQPVAPAVIERILEAATWAPSAHDLQPWRWVVVQSPEARTRLAQKMGEQLSADREALGDPLELIAAALERSYARLTTPPVVLVACLALSDLKGHPTRDNLEAEYLLGVQSVAAAAQNLLLAAHTEGLGACWMSAPLFCAEAAREALQLPSKWEPQALITLGYPAETKEPPHRRRPADVVVFR